MKFVARLLACLAAAVLPAAGLSVLVWNAERGTNPYENGPEKALKVVRDSAADIVLMQESYDIEGDRPELGLWIAQQLGWNAHQGRSPHLCILTRFPIVKTFQHEPWLAIGARIRTPSGDLHAWSCWIDHRSYLPDYLTDNPQASLEELLACETEKSDRLRQARSIINRLRWLGHLNGKVPLLVGGDWNSPSHLDCGPDTRHLRRGHVIPMPVSLALQKEGLVDTFRTVHPSAAKTRGITWSPVYRIHPISRKPVAHDRIDRLYTRGTGLRPLRAVTLPQVPEKPTIRKAKRMFPSDHCAVLTVFE